MRDVQCANPPSPKKERKNRAAFSSLFADRYVQDEAIPLFITDCCENCGVAIIG